MKISPSPIFFILVFLLLFFQNESQACSMYKLTADGKTMVGCNEDAWRTTSRIWFETAKNESEYEAAFTGSRKVGPNQFAPQSGMNTVGLTFSRLVSYFPKSDQKSDKKKITNEVSYLTEILHTCATVADVKRFIEQYDHSIFIDDVFIYIDSSGNYLVVEPYDLIEGSDQHYVLSNFCPSITTNGKARKLERYRNGEDFFNNHAPNASLDFCTAVSDTMHVCRSRNGDGTLLTSIWDTKEGLVNLYFYHSYDSTVQFDIADELAQGDHIINVASLFPTNPEFERLASFKTPFNTASLRVLLVILAGILTLLAFIFIVFSLRNRKTDSAYKSLIFISGLNVALTFYFFVLATNIGIYYFDAPFKHYSSTLISMSSYMPFLLLILTVPVFAYTIRFVRHAGVKAGVKSLLVANNLIYVLSIIAFAYWGLFNFWN